MLVGDGVGFNAICLCDFQIEGRIEDSPNAVILCCNLSRNGLVFLLDEDGVILLIEEQNWQWLVITILLIQLRNLISAFTSQHIQITGPNNSHQDIFFLHKDQTPHSLGEVILPDVSNGC